MRARSISLLGFAAALLCASAHAIVIDGLELVSTTLSTSGPAENNTVTFAHATGTVGGLFSGDLQSAAVALAITPPINDYFTYFPISISNSSSIHFGAYFRVNRIDEAVAISVSLIDFGRAQSQITADATTSAVSQVDIWLRSVASLPWTQIGTVTDQKSTSCSTTGLTCDSGEQASRSTGEFYIAEPSLDSLIWLDFSLSETAQASSYTCVTRYVCSAAFGVSLARAAFSITALSEPSPIALLMVIPALIAIAERRRYRD